MAFLTKGENGAGCACHYRRSSHICVDMFPQFFNLFLYFLNFGEMQWIIALFLLCVVLTDSDGFEFMVVSLDNSTWHFEAQSQEVM